MIPPVEREGTLTTKDGRTLAYFERGSAEGVPVIVSHGTPGSRLARHPDPGIYERHGMHAVVYDRPGYGRSDPKPGRSVADAAADIEAIADELGFERFVVVGGSGGAPHALACGALLGERIIRVGALVTPAPSDTKDFDFFDGLADLNVKEFGAALEGKEAIDAYLEPYVDGIRANPDGVLDEIASELPEVDRAIMNRKEYRDVMRDQFVESVRQGVRGWADDDLAFAKPWGFEPEDVHAEVRLWQGELDVLAPRSHGEYVASRLPNAHFELLEGGGHFLDTEWAVVYDWLTAGAGATEAGATTAGL
jgi:pimeloyl-ACP methyl ester carboxylesterase